MKLPLPFVAAALALMVCGSRAAVAAAEPSTSFVYAQGGHRVKVWYHAPAGLPADAPVVVVLHGINRDADNYVRDWKPQAEAKRFLLVVPEFSQKEFPGNEGYIYGNTVDAQGNPLPREQWAFSVIEPAVEEAKARAGVRTRDYFIYGHSAGAQFVQRFIYFVPEAHVARAVAANAGWYMLPDFSVAFPYGLKGTPVTKEGLTAALKLPLAVLLGTADTNAASKVLRHTPEAEAQGPYRYARGLYFVHYAQEAASRLHVPCHWTQADAPGIGHSDSGMTPFAIKLLFPD